MRTHLDPAEHIDLGTHKLPKLTAAITFESRSEAAAALLMEKHITGWHCVEGATYQVPVGNKKIDFKVREAFVEYHPISFRREFINEQAFHDLVGALRHARRQGLEEMKTQVLTAVKEELAAQYWKRRKDLLAAELGEPVFLIVCHTPEDFRTRVLEKFGHQVPDERKFKQLWKRLLGNVGRAK